MYTISIYTKQTDASVASVHAMNLANAVETDGRFDCGIVGSDRASRKHPGTVTRLEVSTVRLVQAKKRRAHPNASERMSKCLSHEDWIAFNELVNDWLDKAGLSAEVRSSSYVIRVPLKRRVTYSPGNFAGAGDEWADTCAMS